MVARQNILGLTRGELTAFAARIGERPYRGSQMFGWLYRKFAQSFSEMTDLGAQLRQRLDGVALIQGVTPLLHNVSTTDRTTKFLFGLPDKLHVESVLIPPASAFRSGQAKSDDEQRRLTLCVSTQVGCPLDCAFCATATMGFLRNLTAGEIVDQLRHVQRAIRRPVTNVVFMGMGEPLLNYDAVMNASEIFAAGMGIAARRITVSTAGWVDAIRKMADDARPVKLAVSLHSALDETRSRLMPVNRRYNLRTLLEALDYYYRKTKLRVTYEVIFFDGLNDGDHDIAELIAYARRVPSKINVIPFHPIAFASPGGLGARLRPSGRMEEIVERLRSANLTVMVRSSAGEDIAAACGQLAVRHERHRRPGSQASHRATAGPGM